MTDDGSTKHSSGPLSEFFHDAVKEKIRFWLDIRAFLSQRRAIIANPALSFDPRMPEESLYWKTPLKFALQAAVLIGGAAALLTYPIGVMFELTSAVKARESASLLLEKERSRLRTAPAEERKEIEEKISRMERRPNAAETVGDSLASIRKIEVFLIPFGLLLASYTFRWLLGKRQHDVHDVSAVAHAHEVHLAYVMALLFWPTLLFLIIAQLTTMYGEAYHVPGEEFFLALLIAGPCVAFVWTLAMIWKAASHLKFILRRSWERVFWSIIGANVLTNVLLLFAIELLRSSWPVVKHFI